MSERDRESDAQRDYIARALLAQGAGIADIPRRGGPAYYPARAVERRPAAEVDQEAQDVTPEAIRGLLPMINLDRFSAAMNRRPISTNIEDRRFNPVFTRWPYPGETFGQVPVPNALEGFRVPMPEAAR